jgi:hypothetical protein
MSKLLEDVAGEAEVCINHFEAACDARNECADALAAVERERPAQKSAALVRMCAQENPANGKPYSLTAAEDLLQLDPEYAAYRLRVVEAQAALREADDLCEVAKLTAELRIAQFKAGARVI